MQGIHNRNRIGCKDAPLMEEEMAVRLLLKHIICHPAIQVGGVTSDSTRHHILECAPVGVKVPVHSAVIWEWMT